MFEDKDLLINDIEKIKSFLNAIPICSIGDQQIFFYRAVNKYNVNHTDAVKIVAKEFKVSDATIYQALRRLTNSTQETVNTMQNSERFKNLLSKQLAKNICDRLFDLFSKGDKVKWEK